MRKISTLLSAHRVLAWRGSPGDLPEDDTGEADALSSPTPRPHPWPAPVAQVSAEPEPQQRSQVVTPARTAGGRCTLRCWDPAPTHSRDPEKQPRDIQPPEGFLVMLVPAGCECHRSAAGRPPVARPRCSTVASTKALPPRAAPGRCERKHGSCPRSLTAAAVQDGN